MSGLNSYMVILSTYLISSITYISCQWPSSDKYKKLLFVIASFFGVIGLSVHLNTLISDITRLDGLSLTLTNTISLIGFQLALIAIIASFNKSLRGFAGGILFIAVCSALISIWGLNRWGETPGEIKALSWQMKGHVLSSLFAYGLLCAGAIISVFALIQDKRLRYGKISPINSLFAPLETTENLLFGIASFGFSILFLALFSGVILIEDISSQQIPITIFSFTALVMFGVLIYGRKFYGWRGRLAIYLYLSAFLMLAISYFGTRFMLEYILGQSWG